MRRYIQCCLDNASFVTVYTNIRNGLLLAIDQGVSVTWSSCNAGLQYLRLCWFSVSFRIISANSGNPTIMRDPRIDEILERIDETDSSGKATRVADMAQQVKDYLVEIEKLRSEVEIATRQVVYLSGREQSMRVTPTSGANALAPRVDEIEQDFGYHRERLETVSANLKARQGMVKNTQQLISARIGSVQQILDTYSSSSDEDLKSSGVASSAATGTGAAASASGKTKKIIRRRRVVRRTR